MAASESLSLVQPREVVAYKDDVWAWVYFDQIDQVIRYEAYLVDYGDNGEPTTLRLLLEEGLVSGSEIPDSVVQTLLLDGSEASTHDFPIWPHISVSKTSLYLKEKRNIYKSMTKEQLTLLHRCFDRLEHELKRRHKTRWKKRLRLLGYDVIDSAF